MSASRYAEQPTRHDVHTITIATVTTQLLAFSGAIDIQAQDGQSTAAPRFSMVAYTGGAMQLGGWRHPVVVDLAGMSIPSQKRPIRMNHDSGLGVGHTESISAADGKLVAAGVVSRETAAARDVVSSGKNGFPWQASIGASAGEVEFVKAGENAAANGQTFPGPVNIVRKSVLGEISFVDLGADGNTSASIAAQAVQESESMDLTAIKALSDKFPTQASAILASVLAGADPAAIEAQIVEANRTSELATLKASADESKAALAAALAEGEKLKGELKAANEAVAAIKANAPKHADPGTGSGEFRRSQMDLTAKSKFIKEHGRSVYEALPE